MIIYPAIDLYNKMAVRLYKGNFDQMTVYSENPVDVAMNFKKSGALHIHIVDLEGAKHGSLANFSTICDIKSNADLFCEVGGGIRTMETIEKYINSGIDRIILGTAAITDPILLKEAVSRYHEKIAVGVDIRDGFAAIQGWMENSDINAMDFCKTLEDSGVQTIICTDISKDGAMLGVNLKLYRQMAQKLTLNIIASGGVSSLDDIKSLKETGMHGAIIGKAYYSGAIDLREAIEAAS